MKMTPKKFRLIHKSMNEKAETGKTLHDVIQFFWYWKSTANYKQWKRKDRISIEGAANFRLDHAIALKVWRLFYQNNALSKHRKEQRYLAIHDCGNDQGLITRNLIYQW